MSDHPKVVSVHTVETESGRASRPVSLPDYDRGRFEDVAFLTAMTMVLMGNYAQTGHFGGPLAVTHLNVALHLGGPGLGALRYDAREPKLPFADRFVLAGGHCIPSCYALWMILYEALARRHAATGDEALRVDPRTAILAVDALGFRRGRRALDTLLADHGLADHPLFAQAKLRGIRALMGHSESTDATNDVNGGPSGVGVGTTAGKALFWDHVGAALGAPRVFAVEGEFAMTTGHAQELKTAALAHRVGKRLRILLSMNNSGIDDELIGGVVRSEYEGYDVPAQWAAYGWNVLTVGDANDFDDVFGALVAMEEWPEDDRRPMIVVGPTLKGWWPAAVADQLVGPASHPYALPMNGDYFVALAETFEERFGVRFSGIREGRPATEADRLVEFKTNVDVALSVLDREPGLAEWIADRLLDVAGRVDRTARVDIDLDRDPFQDDRLRVENLPAGPVEVTTANPRTGEEVPSRIALFLPPGERAGARRAVSEIGKWMNHVTGGRFLTVAADLSDSLNLERASPFGHYDPVENPAGTRLKAPIQEAVNAATICGIASQNASPDPDRFAGLWGVSGTYGAFTPLMYTPVRVFSQQNQDSPFRLGVVTILAGHSGPETAADARTHFGIFAPGVWTLLPRGQVVNLHFWDYNDVAPGYFAAVGLASRVREVGVIVIHVARPDSPVADRAGFADPDPRAAAKGIYLVRDYDAAAPPGGTVWVQGASSTANLVSVLPRLEAAGVNVRVGAVVSEDLFARAPEEHRRRVLPDHARFDSMVVSTGTKRVPPIANLGPLTEEYSLYADSDDRWRTGGTEADVVAEAGLDPDSVFEGVRRFAADRADRLARQRSALEVP